MRKKQAEVKIGNDKNEFFKLLKDEFNNYPTKKLNSLFTHLDLVYEEIIKNNGGNDFAEPHFK